MRIKHGSTLSVLWMLAMPGAALAQPLPQRISTAMERFNADPQNVHASASLTVLDARTGKTLYSSQGETGLAPASCQKTITAASALFLLGPDFHFRTTLGYSGTIDGHVLKGDLIIRGGGDPTLGSWRYPATKMSVVLARWIEAVKKAGISRIAGSVIGDAGAFDSQLPPDGWIWQDIGNYYGAGASALSWHENQYDLHLRPGTRPGDPVTVLGTDPPVGLEFINELTTGKAGSGDHTYIYAAPYGHHAFLRGTAPADIHGFTVSGSVPDPALFCARSLAAALKKNGIPVSHGPGTPLLLQRKGAPAPRIRTVMDRYSSPELDSVLYWFLKRSINLYGEQLVKAMAMQAALRACTDSGIAVEKRFWQTRGIDPEALHLIDGSGLSPGNRVTTLAMARILYFASRESWFNIYRNCLPVIHGIRMKSGHINGVCSYAGYMESSEGTPLIFSFIVNNYSGSTSVIKSKMFRTLDAIKK